MRALKIKKEIWHFVYAKMKFHAAFPMRSAAVEWAEKNLIGLRWEIISLEISERR